MKLRRKIRFQVALVCNGLLLAGGFLIDLNGNYPGLGVTASFFITYTLLVVGGTSAAVVAITDPARRLPAVIMLVIHVALLLQGLLF